MQYKISNEITEPGIYYTYYLFRDLSKVNDEEKLEYEFLNVYRNDKIFAGGPLFKDLNGDELVIRTFHGYDEMGTHSYSPISGEIKKMLFYGPLKEKIKPDIQVDELTIQKLKDALLIKEIIK